MGAPPAVVNEVRRFRERLVRRLGSVDTVVLFGSQVTGRAQADSDVDLLVVSPAFEGMSSIRRGALALEEWTSDLPVDVLCYTPPEFDRLRSQVSIVRAALDEGVEVGA